MAELVNITTTTVNYESTYDDNKDVIWPTVVGIFVALALGWMICRYKCSSKERSPHIVQCCPESLCKRIQLCCISFFSLCKIKNEPQQPEQPISPSSLILRNKRRSSNHSILEIPFSTNNSRSSVILANQHGPPIFISNNNQRLSNSLLITTTDTSQPKPKIHPLRREESGGHNDRRNSTPWPFPAIHMGFHKQTSEIKTDSVFFNT